MFLMAAALLYVFLGYLYIMDIAEETNILKKPADITMIRKLYRDGLIFEDAYHEALKILRPASSWYTWAMRMLLLTGSALILSGIIFFFAYNWSRIGKFEKFGLIEVLILACIIFVAVRDVNKLSSKVTLMSASVITGVLLAVYGQIYQTGADAYELFTAWALLCAIWVFISNFAGLWFIWIAIVNTAFLMYWGQVVSPNYIADYEWLCLVLAAFNGIALCLREIGLKHGLEWLKGKWLRGVLFAVILIYLSVPVVNLIVDSKDTGLPAIAVSLVWVMTALSGYYCYRKVLPDMIQLAIVVMNTGVLILTFIGNLIFIHNQNADAAELLIFAVIIIAVAGCATLWLKKEGTAMKTETKGHGR
jgi:uncharacterized membrane protein